MIFSEKTGIIYIENEESGLNKPSFHNGVWCNGSTKDFDSFSVGSNPTTPTNIKKFWKNFPEIPFLKFLEKFGDKNFRKISPRKFEKIQNL